MKRTGLLLLAVCMLLLTGACAKMNSVLTVHPNGSADFSLILAADSRLSGLAGDVSGIKYTVKEKAAANGYTADDYAKGSYTGIELKKHISSLETFKGDSSRTNNGNGLLNIGANETKGYFKTTYHVTADIHMEKLSDLTENIGFGSTAAASVLSQVDAGFTLKLPVKAGANNADEKTDSGKTLKWVFPPLETKHMEVTFSKYNISHILYTAGTAAVILCAAILIWKIRKKS